MNLTEIEVVESKEKWNYYALEDGTTLKIKLVLIKVIEEEKDSEGNPIFCLQSSNVVGVTPPASLVESEAIDKFEDIKFSPQNDDWNEYKLKNGFTLMLKPILVQVNRTQERDPKGIPVYNIQAQSLVKVKT